MPLSALRWRRDMVPRCHCRCHCGGAPVFHIAPDLRDHVAAATACSKCINEHMPALTSEWPLPPAPINPQLQPWMDVTDGEGGE